MSVRVRELPGVRVLVASGELDAFTVPPLQARIPAWLDGTSALVLDLCDVTFFDSGAVRLVDSLTRACGEADRGFQVVAPPRNPGRRVLELVGMADGLVHDDVDAACASVRA